MTPDLRRNDPEALPAFARLNLDWIEELHIVEDSDRAMGEDPSMYIAPGNYMLSLHDGETVAGVVALKRDEDGEYELTKLAVDKAYRRQGLGERLMDAAEDLACELGLSRIYLLTSTKNADAVRMYRRLGWTQFLDGEHPKYSRCNIGFEKTL